MNFSGNITQIMIILFIALLVFGPKKMMQYSYQAGKWISQLRKMYDQTMQQVQAEMEQAGLGEAAQLLNKKIDIASEAEKFLNTPRKSEPETAIESATTTAAISDVAAAPTAPIVPPTADTTANTSESAPTEPPKEAGRYNAWLPD
jgi:Sec-independent protein translocase protein TatA